MENQYSMNHTLSNIYKKQLIPLTVFLSLSLIIWFSGPYLTLAGDHPLETSEKRFYLIALLFLGWILKFIFLDTQPKKIKKDINTLTPETAKKIQHLQGKFNGAIEFLKKTTITKHGKKINLMNLPWFLCIGPHQAGKTTLLANSQVNFILAKQFKTENNQSVPPSDSCDWWVTRDLVLVDIPGHYLLSSSKNTSAHAIAYHTLWQHLLSLIKKSHHKKPLHGVIVAIPFPELIKQQKNPHNNAFVHDLRKRINDLLQSFGHDLPIHFIITKCDLLPGFNEFFSEASSDETAQAWGITLPPLTEADNLVESFTQRFNGLIKRLNKQLIPKLHQERNVNIRSYIKDFPLHIERLKEAMIQFLKALMLPQLNLQSLYLTSGHQETSDDNGFLTHQHYSTQALQLLANPPILIRGYFIRQLISHHLLANTIPNDMKRLQKNVLKRRLTYATAITSVLIAAIILGRDFEESLQKVNAIQDDLAKYQWDIQKNKIQGDHLLHALPLLTALQEACTHSTNQLLLTIYSKKSQQTASLVYQQAQQTIVLPEIKHYFERYLQSIDNKNPEQVYGILKAYLMLGDPEQFNANYIFQTLQPLIPTMDKNTLKSFTFQIQSALSALHTPMTLDDDLIADVRKQLWSLASTSLSLVMLKNIDDNQIDKPLGLGTHLGNPPVFLSHSVATQIQTMFTESAFSKIVNDEINQVASDALRGNWIIGINPIQPNQAMIDDLAQQLHTLYIANYVDIWESLLANLQLNTARTLAEQDAMIAIMTSNTSPLLQMLDTVKRNTTFAPIMTASPKLHSLSTLLTNANEPSGLYAIFINLKQLHLYLQTMLNTPEGIVHATTQHNQHPANDPITQLHTLAEQSPEPMKTWLNTIANQTWDLMVKEAKG